MNTVFKNGHVYTMNREMPYVSAVVVEDDKIVYVGKNSLTIEATGDDEKIKGLEDLFRAYGIKEIVRTGKIALSRNAKE